MLVASLSQERAVTGRNELTLQADVALADVANENFDLLLVPGGPGVKALRADGRPAELARAHHQTGKLVAAICAAPVVLKDADLLENRRFTAHFSVYDELPKALAQERVVQDGTILTSRGAAPLWTSDSLLCARFSATRRPTKLPDLSWLEAPQVTHRPTNRLVCEGTTKADLRTARSKSSALNLTS